MSLPSCRVYFFPCCDISISVRQLSSVSREQRRPSAQCQSCFQHCRSDTAGSSLRQTTTTTITSYQLFSTKDFHASAVRNRIICCCYGRLLYRWSANLIGCLNLTQANFIAVVFFALCCSASSSFIIMLSLADLWGYVYIKKIN